MGIKDIFKEYRFSKYVMIGSIIYYFIIVFVLAYYPSDTFNLVTFNHKLVFANIGLLCAIVFGHISTFFIKHEKGDII